MTDRGLKARHLHEGRIIHLGISATTIINLKA